MKRLDSYHKIMNLGNTTSDNLYSVDIFVSHGKNNMLIFNGLRVVCYIYRNETEVEKDFYCDNVITKDWQYRLSKL